MKYEVYGHNIFLIVITCFIASLVLVFFIKEVAKFFNLLDVPSEKRKKEFNKESIPTLGGLGIFLSFLIGYMFFGPKNNLMISILMASFLVLLLGVFDDFSKNKVNSKIPAWIKFIIHLIIASIVVFYGGLELDSAGIFGFYIDFGIFAPYVTIFIIVATISAINFIDGLDGLASGISSIYFLTISILGFILNKYGGLDIILSLIMLGSILGFLYHNFPPAKIYMGDTGATFIGLMIAVIALIGFKTLTLTSLVIPLFILAIPIFDTLFAIIRRKLKGKSVAEADAQHLHHQILRLTSSKTKTVLLIYGVNIVFSIVSILYALGHKTETIIGYVFLIFLLLWLVLKTNIIFDKEDKK